MRFLKSTLIATAFCAGAVSAMGVEPAPTVPVMYLNTENGAQIVSKEKYINAGFYIDPLDSDAGSLGTSAEPVATEIRGRGNYTWIGFDKKPYKLKLAKKTDLMNTDKNKHFALLAHADDNTGFLRNTIGFELSRRMGMAWTPEQRPLQLTLNGSYEGLYFLTQTIRVDKTRVDITEQPDSATSPAEVTGGWLIEIDNYDKDPHITVIEGGGADYPIWFTYKNPEVLSAEQKTFLTEQMETLNRLICAENKDDASQLEAMLDLDAFARFYLVQELTDNTESFHGSCYLYRDRGESAKWKFGPVWDFGNAFQREKNGRRIWQDAAFHQVWVRQLLQFPVVQAKVKEIWLEFLNKGFNGLFESITTFENSIRGAVITDRERWPQYGARDYAAAWHQTAERLKQNLRQVGEWYGAVPEIAPTVYLRGTFNDWGLSAPFSYSSTTQLYTIYCENLDSQFKVATDDWSTIDYGAPGSNPVDLYAEVPFQLVAKGSNINLAVPIKDSVLEFDASKGTLRAVRLNSVDDAAADPENDYPEYFTLDGRPLGHEMPSSGIFVEKRGTESHKIYIR